MLRPLLNSSKVTSPFAFTNPVPAKNGLPCAPVFSRISETFGFKIFEIFKPSSISSPKLFLG